MVQKQKACCLENLNLAPFATPGVTAVPHMVEKIELWKSRLSLEIETETIYLVYSLKSMTALTRRPFCYVSALVASSPLEGRSRWNERVKGMDTIEKEESGVSLLSLLEGLSRSLG